MAHSGKKYQEVKKLVTDESYSLSDAVVLLQKTSPTKFDASCEMHLWMGLDPKQADQMVRGTVALPHGTGKKLRVIAFVPDNMEEDAKKAGAVEAGMALIEKVSKGWFDFDVAVAHPSVMKDLSKIAKDLGQKGLMPNPKAGTVTPDIANTIGEIIKGKVEFRLDKLAAIHNSFGKVSFDTAHLEENLNALLKAIIDAKPSGIKGAYIKKATLATSMGPGIPLNVNELMVA
jgi:large subunit ribosomal protein L1